MPYIIRDRGKPDEPKKSEEEAYVPTAEEEAELEASFAEIERGEWVDGDEFLRDLRRRLSEE